MVLEHLLKNRGLASILGDTFRSFQPYPTGQDYAGGDDIARALASLANRKHTIGLAVNAHIVSATYPRISGHSLERLRVLSPVLDLATGEMELVRWKGDLETDGNYKFGFSIFFQDEGISQPIEPIGGLKLFTDKATTVIDALELACDGF